MYVFPDCEIEIKIPKRLHGYFSFLLPNKISEKTLLSYFSRELSYIFSITVFSRIEAAVSICFLYFLVRFLFEGGFYSREASIYRNSLSVIRQIALFRNFFSRVGL